MKIDVYPGSFDPITNGHLDIIKRASKLFDKLYVLVSVNSKKKYLLSIEERKEIVEKSVKDLKNVEVRSSSSLTLDFARSVNACSIVRGVRSYKDFDAEMELFQFNHTIDNNIDTILLFPSANNLFLSSSRIKELILFNSSIDSYVPKVVKDEIYNKLKERLG